jgi:NAD(P)H dehydrogenase (quinone)
MQNIAVVYYSGYGHTKLVAEKVAQGAHADLISIDNEGNITEQEWEKLDAADAIIFGAPTYMGGAPWQFKKFADASLNLKSRPLNYTDLLKQDIPTTILYGC